LDLLIWSHIYSVGNDEIDQQHQKLMQLINTLYHAQYSGSSTQVSTILRELVDYTVYHFQAEEKIQQAFQYPEYSRHKQIHIDLIQEVSGYVDQLQKEDETIKERLMVFLSEWLKNHILGEDKKLGKFIRDSKNTDQYEDL